VRLLLDANALLWWFEANRRLSIRAQREITSPGTETFVSAAAVWELAIKTAIGKLDAQALLDTAEQRFQAAGFIVLAINVRHAIRAASLPPRHKDPFDRMLIAQAEAENLAVVSSDPVFEHYGVRRIW
jgi:PIN domain nuclease of toxin-antitoxin system